MDECSRLRTFPDISSNIKFLDLKYTKIEDIPSLVVGRWSRLDKLSMGSKSLKKLTHAPLSVTLLDLSNSDIKMIPDCVIGLPHLVNLYVDNCTKLVSIPGLSPSLESLMANNCVSLKRVCCSFHKPTMELTFYNCLKLDEESRRRITQQPVHGFICLPGKEFPAEFTHKATGNSITIPLAPGSERIISAFSRFKACLLPPPNKDFLILWITCRLISKGGVQINSISKSPDDFRPLPPSLSEHLFIFGGHLFDKQDRCQEVDQSINEILFELTLNSLNNCCKVGKVIECGVQILREEADESSRSTSEVDHLETGGNSNHHTDGEAYTSHWSWLKNLILSNK